MLMVTKYSEDTKKERVLLKTRKGKTLIYIKDYIGTGTLKDV